jgi:hypothetical protein
MDSWRSRLVGCTSVALVLFTVVLPVNARAQQGNTYRIRIIATSGESEPGRGDPLEYHEEVVGTVALSEAAAGYYAGQHYVGRRLERRVEAVYRGMRGFDPGEPCAWTLNATAPVRVTFRALEADVWELTIVSDRDKASIQTNKGSCPASEITLDRPFLATVVTLEGPTPFAAGRVYRVSEDREPYRLTLTVLDVCDGTTFRDGPKDAHSESVRDAVASGLHAHGSTAGPEVVGIAQSSIVEFNVRLGRGHEPLPNRACLEEHIKAGDVDEGALAGAKHLLVGGVQEVDGQTRVTVRTVDVATGEVVATGKADASGPDAVGSAMRQAIAQLGWSFGG